MIQSTLDRLTRLGTIRDGVLVAGALIYAAGYAVWALHAWRNNLGILPALDFQYFVAGSMPVLIIGASLAAGRTLWRFVMQVWPSLVGPEATGLWWFVRVALLAMFAVTMWLVFFLAYPSYALLLGSLGLGVLLVSRSPTPQFRNYEALSRAGRTWRVILMIAGVAIILAIFWYGETINAAWFGFVEPIERKAMRGLVLVLFVAAMLLPPAGGVAFGNILKVFYYAMTVVLLPVLGLVYYLFEAYPRLPQELGGVHPRCAYVDLATASLAPETRHALVPEVRAGSDGVVRSKRLEVMFSANNFMLVRRPAEPPSQVIHELLRSDIKHITWCAGGDEFSPSASPQ